VAIGSEIIRANALLRISVGAKHIQTEENGGTVGHFVVTVILF